MVIRTEAPEVVSVEVEYVTHVPLYIVALNRMARLGLGSLYTPSHRFVKFSIEDTLASKWLPLRDAVSCILCYRDQKGKEL